MPEPCLEQTTLSNALAQLQTELGLDEDFDAGGLPEAFALQLYFAVKCGMPDSAPGVAAANAYTINWRELYAEIPEEAPGKDAAALLKDLASAQAVAPYRDLLPGVLQ